MNQLVVWQFERLKNWAQRILCQKQDDQIGQTFAYWAIVSFGQFYKNYRSCPKCCATFPRGKSYILILAQSFSPNLAQDGQQTCRPAQKWVTSLSASSKKQGEWITSYLCYFLLAFWSH
jgi:hypothetical protein